jgi:CheY-like chemotaxis protein
MCIKLLIVDDNADNRSLIVSVFRRLKLEGNVEVLEAANGDDALDVAIREKPALILLDVMMPGLSGYEVCRTVKSKADLAGTHIIMLTAADSPEDRKLAEAAGADGFILKPYDITVLRERIRKQLEPQLTASVQTEC